MTEKTWFWTCNILPEFSELKGTEHNWPGMVSQKHHRFTIIINLPSLYCLNFWNFLLLCFQPGSDWFFFLLSLQNDRPTVQIQSNSERARASRSLNSKWKKSNRWKTSAETHWTLTGPCVPHAAVKLNSKRVAGSRPSDHNSRKLPCFTSPEKLFKKRRGSSHMTAIRSKD